MDNDHTECQNHEKMLSAATYAYKFPVIIDMDNLPATARCSCKPVEDCTSRK